MKKAIINVVILATHDVAKILKKQLLDKGVGKNENQSDLPSVEKYNIFTIDLIADREISFTKKQNLKVKSAKIIFIEYDENKFKNFAESIASAISSAYLEEKYQSGLPIFKVIYNAELRETPILLDVLIDETKKYYLRDILGRYLSLELEEELLESLTSAEVRKVNTWKVKENSSIVEKVTQVYEGPVTGIEEIN